MRIPRACPNASEQLLIGYQLRDTKSLPAYLQLNPKATSPFFWPSNLTWHRVHSISLSTQVSTWWCSLGVTPYKHQHLWVHEVEAKLFYLIYPETSAMLEQTHSQLNNITEYKNTSRLSLSLSHTHTHTSLLLRPGFTTVVYFTSPPICFLVKNRHQTDSLTMVNLINTYQ